MKVYILLCKAHEKRNILCVFPLIDQKSVILFTLVFVFYNQLYILPVKLYRKTGWLCVH